MGQVIAFANNQVMIAPAGGMNTIYTDPVPLGDADRASCNFVVDYIFNSGANGVGYAAQASNDGVNWLDVGGLSDDTTAAGIQPQVVGAVHGAFIRFRFTLDATVGTGAAGFDLHVLLDHA